MQTERRKENLVVNLVETLRNQIKDGAFEVGGRLPSEARLTETHQVSRTVVREAIAVLRAEGLVDPRQGAGVFVLRTQPSVDLPFQDIDPGRVASVLDILELRAAVEIEAAGLAAERGSPDAKQRILDAHQAFSTYNAASGPTAPADFTLHLAIADAAGNSRFGEFLRMLGERLIPRHALRPARDRQAAKRYREILAAEHREIVDAILAGDRDGARAAMRRHLEGSRDRYRSLLAEVA